MDDAKFATFLARLTEISYSLASIAKYFERLDPATATFVSAGGSDVDRGFQPMPKDKPKVRRGGLGIQDYPAILIAKISFGQKDDAKQAGFMWDALSKQWWLGFENERSAALTSKSFAFNTELQVRGGGMSDPLPHPADVPF